MKLKLDQHSPIYLQIIDEFKRQIARGDLRPGDRIPSQRELAMMVQVNPNTVQ
ncbi:MAG: GntR family transcriptional regulator, partial [Bacillota bacterium]